MRTPVKLGAYAVGLILIFGVTAAAGGALGPDQQPARAPAHTGAHAPAEATAGAVPAAPGTGEEVPGGLQIAQSGFRLSPLTTRLPVGAAQPFRFRVLGPDGAPVTDYVRNHDKDLHLIVVRRDLSGYQHVHPALAADGTWSVPLAVGAPGQYRVLADFQAATGTGGKVALTLGVDVPAPGDYQPVALPQPARTAQVDGYTVTLTGDLRAGATSTLGLAVSRGGEPVTDLEPYLGALGHLVVLREGDLAYLHVHPTRTDVLEFQAQVPSAGVYRLYLDFQHAGKVRTAEFTATTDGVVAAPAPTGHDADGHSHD